MKWTLICLSITFCHSFVLRFSGGRIPCTIKDAHVQLISMISIFLFQDGATLMHYAVQTASSQAIKMLLLYNVDINLCDSVSLKFQFSVFVFLN